MPTASSAQMKSRTARITIKAAIRYLGLFIFLIASSHSTPVPSNKTPAMTKSNSVHFTSSVNCIAINGISKSIAVMELIIKILLFFIIIWVLLCKSSMAANRHQIVFCWFVIIKNYFCLPTNSLFDFDGIEARVNQEWDSVLTSSNGDVTIWSTGL